MLSTDGLSPQEGLPENFGRQVAMSSNIIDFVGTHGRENSSMLPLFALQAVLDANRDSLACL